MPRFQTGDLIQDARNGRVVSVQAIMSSTTNPHLITYYWIKSHKPDYVEIEVEQSIIRNYSLYEDRPCREDFSREFQSEKA